MSGNGGSTAGSGNGWLLAAERWCCGVGGNSGTGTAGGAGGNGGGGDASGGAAGNGGSRGDGGSAGTNGGSAGTGASGGSGGTGGSSGTGAVGSGGSGGMAPILVSSRDRRLREKRAVCGQARSRGPRHGHRVESGNRTIHDFLSGSARSELSASDRRLGERYRRHRCRHLRILQRKRRQLGSGGDRRARLEHRQRRLSHQGSRLSLGAECQGGQSVQREVEPDEPE